MGELFAAVWDLMRTPMTLPWIGNTSPLAMTVLLSALYLIVDLTTGLMYRKKAGDD